MNETPDAEGATVNKLLYTSLPYVLLAALAIMIILETGGGMSVPLFNPQDLVSQLSHWLARGAAAVTVADPRINATGELAPAASVTAVVVIFLRQGWWSREEHLRERDAGQLLEVLTDARGKEAVEVYGATLEGFQRSGFALIMDHHDALALQRVISELLRLPAAEWLEPEVIFFGSADPGSRAAPSQAEVSEPGDNPGSRKENAQNEFMVLMFEKRSSDWFLLGPDKRRQLLGPREEVLQSSQDIGAVSYRSLGFGPFTHLTVVRASSLTALSVLHSRLRSNWEQKYVTEIQVYLGLVQDVSTLFGGLR